MNTTFRRNLWAAGLLLGVVLIGLGAFFVVSGIQAKNKLVTAMAAEQISTSASASIPSQPIVNAATAQSQQDLLFKHSVGTYGPYSKLAKDDPNRASYLDALTIRNSLNMAVMGFGVSNLAMGAGAVIILLGLGAIGVGVPVLYWIRIPEGERVAVRGRKGKKAYVTDGEGTEFAPARATTLSSKSEA